MVVVFHLGVEVDLQHFSNFLPVHGGHGETDGFPSNWSFIQGQEDCYAIGWVCKVKIKTIGTSDDVRDVMRCDWCQNLSLLLRNVESSDTTELLVSVEVGAFV